MFPALPLSGSCANNSPWYFIPFPTVNSAMTLAQTTLVPIGADGKINLTLSQCNGVWSISPTTAVQDDKPTPTPDPPKKVHPYDKLKKDIDSIFEDICQLKKDAALYEEVQGYAEVKLAISMAEDTVIQATSALNRLGRSPEQQEKKLQPVCDLLTTTDAKMELMRLIRLEVDKQWHDKPHIDVVPIVRAEIMNQYNNDKNLAHMRSNIGCLDNDLRNLREKFKAFEEIKTSLQELQDNQKCQNSTMVGFLDRYAQDTTADRATREHMRRHITALQERADNTNKRFDALATAIGIQRP